MSSQDITGRAFLKMHGLRNHFVIVDARESDFAPPVPEIVRICDGQVGVGADQLVVLEPPRDPAATAFMRLYNVDGREVGACGNATRCVAWLLLEELEVDEVHIETLAGVLACERAGALAVSCDLGPLRSHWSEIPMAREQDSSAIDLAGLIGGVAVNVGNPHLVFFVDDLDAVDLEGVAPEIQSNPLFPEQVNVSVGAIIGRQALRLRVYERGAGLTQACGTGACAAVHAARLRGLVGEGPVLVSLPGGDVSITIDRNNHALMTGPVAYAFKGTL